MDYIRSLYIYSIQIISFQYLYLNIYVIVCYERMEFYYLFMEQIMISQKKFTLHLLEQPVFSCSDNYVDRLKMLHDITWTE